MKQPFVFLLWDPVLEKSLIRLLAQIPGLALEVWDVRPIMQAYLQADTAYIREAGVNIRRIETVKALEQELAGHKNLLFGTRITLFYGGNHVLRTIHVAGNALMAFRIHPVYGDIPYLDQAPFIAEWKADRSKNRVKRLMRMFRAVDIRNASTYKDYLDGVHTINYYVHVGSYSLQQQVFRTTEQTQCFSVKNPDITWFELQNQQVERLVEKPYILFLDNDYALHADFARKATGTEIKQYYFQLNHLFRKLEEKLGIEVVVALHPKANREKVEKYWQGRSLFQHQTPLLIRDAALNLCHHTTSLNWAAYFGKPVAVVLNDLVALRGEREYVLAFAQEIGAGVLDCNEPENIDASTIFELPTEMESFREKYICTQEYQTLEQVFEQLSANYKHGFQQK